MEYMWSTCVCCTYICGEYVYSSPYINIYICAVHVYARMSMGHVPPAPLYTGTMLAGELACDMAGPAEYSFNYYPRAGRILAMSKRGLPAAGRATSSHISPCPAPHVRPRVLHGESIGVQPAPTLVHCFMRV